MGDHDQMSMNARQNKIPNERDDLVDIWEVLGRRWTLLILKNFCTKEIFRFNELKKVLPGISSTVLAERLLELERAGLVSKKIYPEIPPKVEYRMTMQAKELDVIFKELGSWASRWKKPQLKRRIAHNFQKYKSLIK
jgi:DNA-binding HxlR family transcriptional regulator